ncbi:hypothetical protein CSAL01_02813 [Colletotrichum salicis]|uniref:Secreted protein n=1 Tax=Colletotrichum salicis TaxID=1209931 RepID=A0A135SZI8_9PEZI|nr:hypothetical protein CSAL01_02813 [Colletotrichum salicis]
MCLIQILPLALLGGPSSVLGECYKSGPRTGYTNDNDVLDLGVLCGLLIGLYNKVEFRRICVRDKNGIKWDIELKYFGSGATRTIHSPEYVNGFSKEAKCAQGGHTAYGNWEYTHWRLAGAAHEHELFETDDPGESYSGDGSRVTTEVLPSQDTGHHILLSNGSSVDPQNPMPFVNTLRTTPSGH